MLQSLSLSAWGFQSDVSKANQWGPMAHIYLFIYEEFICKNRKLFLLFFIVIMFLLCFIVLVSLFMFVFVLYVCVLCIFIMYI